MNFDDLCPSDMIPPVRQEAVANKCELQNFLICGKEVPRGYWVGTRQKLHSSLFLLLCSGGRINFTLFLALLVHVLHILLINLH